MCLCILTCMSVSVFLFVCVCVFMFKCACYSLSLFLSLSLSVSLSPSLSLPISLYVCACVCKNAEERIGFRENRKCSWINKYDSNMKSFIVTFWVTVAPPNFIYLSLCLFVCPPFTACIWITMGLILIKLGGGVGIEVRLKSVKCWRHYDVTPDLFCSFAKGKNSVA